MLTADGYQLLDDIVDVMAAIIPPAQKNMFILRSNRTRRYIKPSNNALRERMNRMFPNVAQNVRVANYHVWLLNQIFEQLSEAKMYLGLVDAYLANLVGQVGAARDANLSLKALKKHMVDKFRINFIEWIGVDNENARNLLRRRIPFNILTNGGVQVHPTLKKIDQYLRGVSYISHYLNNDHRRKQIFFQMIQEEPNTFSNLNQRFPFETIQRYHSKAMISHHPGGVGNSVQHLRHIDTVRIQLVGNNIAASFRGVLDLIKVSNLFTLIHMLSDVQRRIVLKFKIWGRGNGDMVWKNYVFSDNGLRTMEFVPRPVAVRGRNAGRNNHFNSMIESFERRFRLVNDTTELLRYGNVDEGYAENLGELKAQGEVRYEVWIQSVHQISGGCVFKHNHRTTIQDEDSNIVLHVESLVSRSNNCGIQLFIRFYKELIRGLQLSMSVIPYQYQVFVSQQAKTVKKKLFPEIDSESKLTLVDMEVLVEYFECDITIYDKTLNRVMNTSNEYKSRLLVYWDGSHYWFIRNMKCKTPNMCEVCFLSYNSNHTCIMSSKYSSLQEDRDTIRDLYQEAGEDKEDKECKEKNSGWDMCDDEEDEEEDEEDEERIPIECKDIMNSLIDKQRHVLIHGPGGTGKTTTIRYITKKLRSLNLKVCVTALTGIAATHIQGVTLHSAIKVGLNLFKPIAEVVKKQKKDKKYLRFIQNLQVLIIDEISMMNDILFRRLHSFLSLMRENNLLFGGVQLFLSGDVLQLPPVNSIGYPSFFFRSPVFEEILLSTDIYNFNKIYRQLDPLFQETLNAIRIGEAKPRHILLLQSRLLDVEDEHVLHIFPKRKMVLEHNKKMIAKIDASKEKYTFESQDSSQTNKVILDRSTLVTDRLVLVEGARVMIIRNLKIGRTKVFNGDQGVFVGYIKKNDTLKIKLDRGGLICVERMKFSLPIFNTESDSNPYRIQFPIILAYAITIHKSQGMTLYKAVIDVGSSIFESSQVYVALSRMSDIKGLYLKAFSPDKIQVKKGALNFNNFVDTNNVYVDTTKRKCFLQNISSDLNTFVSSDKWTFHELREKKFDMLEKTIFFDFETYVDKDDGILHPYYNHLVYYENGKVCKSTTFQLGVNSEDVGKSSFDWLFNIIENDSHQYQTKYKKGGMAGRWSRYKPIYLCAYNGSNFDFHWLLKYLLHTKSYGERYSSHQVLKGSSIVSLQLYDEDHGRIILKTHDICNILTSSLDEAVKSFCGESLKGTFPHKYMNKIQGRVDKNVKYVKLDMDDFFEAHHPKVLSLVENEELDLDRYDLQGELTRYGISDVVIMVKLYKAVDVICRSTLHTNIFSFNTASSMTRWGFMINLPKNAIIVRNKKYIISKLNSWSAEDEVKIRKAVYAGKTLPRIVQYTSSQCVGGDDVKYSELEKDHYVYLDASGFYASVMLNEKYPIGPYTHLMYENVGDRMDLHYLRSFYKDKETMFNMKDKLPLFIGYCHIAPNVYDVEPCIGRRDEIGKLHWDNIPRWGWYSSISVELAIKAGGKLLDMTECYYWMESCYIFKKWMNYTIGLKNSTESGKKKLGKLLGNGTYGINLQRSHDDIIKIVKNKKQLNDFHSKYNWTDVFPSGGNLIMKGVPQIMEKKPSRHPIHLGVFILDYTKKIIHQITESANPLRYSGSWKSVLYQPLYGDTDSLVFHCSQLPWIHNLIGKVNGQWGDEIFDGWEKKGFGDYIFARICKWVGAQPKLYSLIAKLPNDKVYSKLKCKGIPQNNISYEYDGELYKKMNYEVLAKLVENDEKLSVTMSDRLKRLSYRLSSLDKMKDVDAFSIRSQTMSRTIFQSKWLGRRLLSEEEERKVLDILGEKDVLMMGKYKGFTVPHGWISRPSEEMDMDMQMDISDDMDICVN